QSKIAVLSCIRHPLVETSDQQVLLSMVGQLWANGIPVDWSVIYQDKGGNRIALPTYPFQRKRYWVDARNGPEVVETQSESVASNYIAAKSDTEKQLVSHWQSLLGIESVGIEDDFFELGGDSLLVTRALSLISQGFAVSDQQFSIKQFFAQPTIKHIARQISEPDQGDDIEEGVF
ncbi:MAG: phosphopantetheine-binding protein, partial [Psychrosphaera sp.]|nr:phosphopantetheine-binding protein [Psychrosphaera sp.]